MTRLTAFAVAAGALASCAPAGDPDVPGPAAPSTSFAFQALDTSGPTGRWGTLVAPAPDGAFLFGGAAIDLLAGTGTVLDELWRVVIEGEDVSFRFVDTTGDAPDARYCGCAAFDAERNELVVLGGRADRAKQSAFVLDVAAGAWSEVQGDVPEGNIGCSITFVEGTSTAYAFGGGSDFASFDETWRFDGAARAFTLVDVGETKPSARYDHVVKALPDGDLLLIAGAANAFQGFSAEVWRFDVESESWAQLADDGAAGPVGRRTPWASLSEDGARLLMGFGVNGMDGDSDLADLWELDLADATWTEAELSGELPPARGFSTWLPGPEGTAGILWSGTDMEHTLDDAWLLQAPPDTRWR